MNRGVTAINPGKYSLLQLSLPSKPVRNIGIFLLDPATNRLYKKLRSDWATLADPEDAEVLEALDADFDTKIAEMGGEAFLHSLEQDLSHTLQITNRSDVSAPDFQKALARLYEEHVQRTEVIPFVTHVPQYSLRAAAGRFGEDMEVEAEGWVVAPKRRKLDRNMFAARVVGRSMEPLIPDGSLCLFHAGVVGSRQGKRLLIQKIGATDTSAEFTVKVYTSKKLEAADGEWRHLSILLSPLNPEFEAMKFGPEDENKRFRVIAEFVCVLEEHPL